MLRVLVLLLLTLAMYTPATSAADLYRINVDSRADADALTALDLDLLLRLPDGYLVLAGPEDETRMAQAQLSFERIAADVDRRQVALDIRRDDINAERYPVVFEHSGVRLLRVDIADLVEADASRGLAPLTIRPKVVFSEPQPLAGDMSAVDMDLNALISLVSQDSLTSYLTQITTYVGRTPGSQANAACQEYLIGKLEEFGYDTVVIDGFALNVSARGGSDVSNVLVRKTGTEYPNHWIVVGAHFDAVENCPGADDNGSGTAAVLEMARVLRDIDTKIGVEFILFNAEEVGLYGSSHAASLAAMEGRNIIYMLNMDMIAELNNESEAALSGGPNEDFMHLWGQLADSLDGIDITATYGEMPYGSDHFPYYQAGFDVICVQEWETSTVYHSHNDNIGHIDFNYYTRMVKSGLATIYASNSLFAPPASLAFYYPDGLPELLFPDLPTTVTVRVIGTGGGQVVDGTGFMRVGISGHIIESYPLVSIGGDLYEATIPAQECYSQVSLRFSMNEVSAGRVNDPVAGQYQAVAANIADTVLFDDFDDNMGWTVQGDAIVGAWERSVPYFWGMLDGAPGWDFGGTGYCFLTGEQTSPYLPPPNVDDGTTSLISPMFDAEEGLIKLEYYRWFYTDKDEDVFSILTSNDSGATWVVNQTVGPDVYSSGGWMKHSFFLNDYSTLGPQSFVRFDAADLGDDQTVEAAVDNITLVHYLCEPGPQVITEALPEWTAGVYFDQQLEIMGGYGVVTCSDKNNDLEGSGLTLSETGQLSGIPAVEGEVSFIAMVIDENMDDNEKALTVSINPSLEVTTVSIPNAIEGLEYSSSLSGSGGTGVKTWTDLDGDLAGSGITLAADGVLSGTAAAVGDYSFVARVTDEVGAVADRTIGFAVDVFYICGDIDHDGADVNISDLTYFVDYMFAGGPPPPVVSSADVNASGSVDVSDLTFMVDFLFASGPPPECQ